MGSSNDQDSQVIQTRPRSVGRGFAAVDPERQREIDVEHATALANLARRDEPSSSRARRPAPSGWFYAQRDPGDEGGSVRRSR